MKSYREELWFETKTRRDIKRGIPSDIPRAPWLRKRVLVKIIGE